jgi:prevent-host-death family protein
MKSWSVQDAKARFSEFLETCLNEGPQLVTRRGAEAAVLLPLRDWRRLERSSRPTLKDLLLFPEPRMDLAIPRRGRRRRRPAFRID